MLNEKENTKKNDVSSADKKIGGTAGMVIGYVLVYLLVVGIIYTAFQIPATVTKMSERAAIKDSKVVLYEGPKSLKDATDADLMAAPESEKDITLKHCVDTIVTVNGEDCYVYDTNVNNTHTWEAKYQPVQERTPITYFDFEGTVEISIKVPYININSVTVRPLSYDIKPEIDQKNHTVTFCVSNPDAYTVEFNGSVQRAVHIFANEIETDKPDPEDKDVLYLGPGEWTAENVNLKKGQTLYISGGAVLHAPVNANFVNNVKVMGRGIIDNSDLYGWQGRSAHVPLKFDGCQNVTVEGIISLNSNAWCFQAYNGIDIKVDGLKIITSRPNGDGMSIQSCKSVNIKNSFVRAWDDALVVKNYDENSSGIKFSNMQIWSDLAQCMEVGYETNKGCKENSTIKDVTFEDITVLHAFHKPVVSIHNADDAAVSDIKYKNIVVEDASMGLGDGTFDLIDFKIVNNPNWSSTKERGTISNVLVDGLKVISGNDMIQSTISGFDEEHKVDGVTIKGLSIKGNDIKTFEDGNFKIDENKTANLVIE